MGAGVILLTCMIFTWLQVRHWRDSISLFTHTLEVTGENPVIHTSLGVALATEGKADQAIAHYEEALRLEPNYPLAQNNLGVALASQGKTDQAVAHYEEALRLTPNYVEARENLGDTLFNQGKFEQSEAHYLEVLRLQPKSPETHGKLGMVAAELGKMDQALVHYQEALGLKPDYPQALNNLALILATAANPKFRDGAKAVHLAERANRLSGEAVPTMMYTLAAAYAEAGRFPEAIKTSQEAGDLARSSGDEDLAKAIENRLRLYRAGRPFHEGQGN
jgi:tetratricopeptide (TPR) repeat protein